MLIVSDVNGIAYFLVLPLGDLEDSVGGRPCRVPYLPYLPGLLAAYNMGMALHVTSMIVSLVNVSRNWAEH